MMRVISKGPVSLNLYQKLDRAGEATHTGKSETGHID